MHRVFVLVSVLFLICPAASVLAQGGDDLPEVIHLDGFRHEYQGWNNCGPATLTTTLSYYGWRDDQYTAANWLKPDPEDKNVSAWQMAAFVESFTDLHAVVRYAGDVSLLKRLIASGYPVIIAAGYEPEGYEWMGHYLLVTGYDDVAGIFVTQDSFLGPNTEYAQQEIDTFWRHFNRIYLVVYASEQESALFNLLGKNASDLQNASHAVAVARSEAAANPADPYAWFNLGTSFVLQAQYAEAAVAFDQARNAGDGLPWRMLWYQFGPFEAYYHTGRFDDVISLAQYNLATTPDGEHPIEETYYYAGLARAALGQKDRAESNLRQALIINPNFTPGVEALAAFAGVEGG